MNIIISGMTCSGKTTLSNYLSKEYNMSHFEEDWYFKDKKDIPLSRKGYLMDLPNAFNIEEFANDSKALIEKKKVIIPTYDLSANKRVDKSRIIRTNGRVIFEGLHTIDALKDLRDTLKVFIEIDKNISLERRIKRDKSYGISEEEIRKYFNDVILCIYRTHIEPQKKDADIILDGGENIKCLSKKLQSYL